MHRLWVIYRWEFVNCAAMTVVGLLNLSSAIRFHSEGGSTWLAFSGVFMVVVGSANLILQWRRLPTTGEG